MRLGWASVLLLSACSEELVAEVRPSIGRVGSAATEGRVLHVEEDDDDQTEPMRALDDDGAGGVPIEVLVGGKRVAATETNGDGTFRVALDRVALRPGTRRVVVRGDGGRLGVGRVTLLGPDRGALVVTSDVDMTYLETRFRTALEMAALLRMAAREHRPLAGMPGLYARLRRRADALRFVSGSPEIFRRHLDARLELDRVPYDELALKPFGEILARNWKQPATIEAALREQVGFKILALLEARLRLPPVCREVLLGDDTEMDAWAYGLYRDSLRPDGPGGERLRDSLAELGVGESSRPAIVETAERARAWSRGGGVVFIGIRQTDRPNRARPAGRVSGIVLHRTTEELSRALHAHGLL